MRSRRFSGVFVGVAALLVAVLVPAAGTRAIAGADSVASCRAPWPASPAGFAAFDLAGDPAAANLCWAEPPLTSGGSSGVVAVAEGVVVTARGVPGTNETSALTARDARSGALLWRHDGIATYLAQPKVAAGGLLVAPTSAGDLVVALDLHTGAVRWQFDATGPSGARRRAVALDAPDVVFVTVHAAHEDVGIEQFQVVALDRTTGVERWRRDGRALAASGTTVLVQAAQRPAGTIGSELAGLDSANGTVRWQRSVGPEFPSGVVSAGGLFVGRGESRFVLQAIEPATGEVVWRAQVPDSGYPVGQVITGPRGDDQIVVRAVANRDAATTVIRSIRARDGSTSWERDDLYTVLGGGDGVVLASQHWSLDLPPGATDLRTRDQGVVAVLDASTGSTLRTLPRGPWRLEPAGGVVGGGLAVIRRAPVGPRYPESNAYSLATGVPGFCRRSPGEAGAYAPPAGGNGGAAPSPVPSAFVPLPPTRLFDSRDAGTAGYVCPGERLTLHVIGQAGIPAEGVTAIAMNLTITRAGSAGFTTIWPAGVDQPTSSVLNVTEPYQTRANLVVVPVGADGDVSMVTQAGGHLVADVAGYFVARPSATAGRIVALSPRRLLDTRETNPVLGPNATVTVPVAGADPDVPAGAVAAVVTVTATAAAEAGFVTAWPSGIDRPLVSNLNIEPGESVANLAIVPVGADGALHVFTQPAAQLVVDLVGYVTGVDAVDSSSGLFVPLSPRRLFDTRADLSGGVLTGGSTISPVHGGRAGIPTDAAAVFVQVTGVDATADTHVRVWPTGSALPLASSLNLGMGDTRAAATLARLGNEARVSYFDASGAIGLVVDVAGYVQG